MVKNAVLRLYICIFRDFFLTLYAESETIRRYDVIHI